MIKTGNILLDFFLFISIVFPLLPVAFIFIKKNYHNESLNFLMILCLINFIKEVLLFIQVADTGSQNIIINIFSFFEFIFLMLIFRRMVPKKLKNIANIFFSVFLSVILTIYFFEGLNQQLFFVEEFQNIIIILASVFCAAKLAYEDNLDIFTRSIFWVAIGSLFYFTIAVLIQSLSKFYHHTTDDSIPENRALLNLGNIFRYFFYLLAAFVHENGDDKKERKMY